MAEAVAILVNRFSKTNRMQRNDIMVRLLSPDDLNNFKIKYGNDKVRFVECLPEFLYHHFVSHSY